MDMTFDQAFAEKCIREMLHDAAAIRLRAIVGDERGPMNLTPDHIKSTPEWQYAYNLERALFDNMRRWNRLMAKHFKKELREYYANKKAEKIAANQKGN